MNFKLSNEIYEELISNKYPTLFEIEIGGKEKIKVVGYKDYKRLENIIKEVRDKKEELMYLASKYSVIYRNNIEVVAIYDRLKELFEILDKGNNNEEDK